MADEIPTEALEAAARDVAAITPLDRHGQLCPVWAKKRPIGECDCWIMTRACAQAAAAAAVLIAEGRRQAAEAIRAVGRDTYQNAAWLYPDEAARIAETGMLRAEIATEIRARAGEFKGVDEAGDAVAEWAARIAEGGDHG